MSVLTKIFATVFSLGLLVLTFSTLLVVPSYAQTSTIPSNAQLCGTSGCPLVSDPTQVKGDQNRLAGFIIGIARFLTFVGAAVATLALVYGGILYVTDNGDGKGAEKGKTILINSVIGLVVVIVAYTIVGVVGNLVQGNLAGQFLTP